MDNCKNIEPTPDDNKLAMTLSVVISGFFTDEKAQAYKFHEVLQVHNINIMAMTISGTTYVTDGDIQYKGFHYAITKVKNELGSMVTEPHMQTILYYIHSTESFTKAKPTFRFPCITITLFGPHIDFSAAVWSTRPNMQVILTALPLFHHPTDSKMCVMVARHIGAFRKALRSLLACYQGMTSPSPDQDLEFLDSKFQDPMFPYPYSFTCMETLLTCDFTYYNQMDQSRLLFSAVKMTDDKKLCIKFVRCYSKELPGGWYMVVMEMIMDDYCHLQEITIPYPHHDALATELQSLHQGGYVHGDIQDTNIMVKKDCSPGFMLMDFDWSRTIGEARYPMNVYRGECLWRPDGVEDGQLIMPEHDMQMLHAIFLEGTFV
ncbi:uncharacterized protein F5891DRAFT_1129342 [Suillus fuscotomentosus]|uniref:Protein kinase domain-containing protein n=1 Tax=Suillus fuscotomentosus TaxID=1912939 RepID=A0AAD4HJR4_9AGAM|nr:uncharacterized protein F5891DRAFT_1129342 [Suillus fuscotomentosus]KAG1898721.1 hypothetical protein F5891DRAFT_1129342 [Suillus fuscotomentosus]